MLEKAEQLGPDVISPTVPRQFPIRPSPVERADGGRPLSPTLYALSYYTCPSELVLVFTIISAIAMVHGLEIESGRTLAVTTA